MSTKPMKPIKKPPKQLNIEDTESLKCDACGNYTFIKSYFIRRVSPLMSPTGQEAMIPIEVFACGNCGKVPDKMIPSNDS
tara:strand:- start:1470 stop:1709 length:240 start_codon:yes stop_codon:yes gene_type:complete